MARQKFNALMQPNHWETVYREKVDDDLSWHQTTPELSTDLIRRFTPLLTTRIIDVGAGTSSLVDTLLASGYSEITVLDIAAEALAKTRERLGERGESVSFLEADILSQSALSQYDLWHDRALFHFLTIPHERACYVRSAKTSVVPGGFLIVSAFALDGPASCSGLPVCRYDDELLYREFSEGFNLKESIRVKHRTPWGAVQPFTVIVLQRFIDEPKCPDRA